MCESSPGGRGLNRRRFLGISLGAGVSLSALDFLQNLSAAGPDSTTGVWKNGPIKDVFSFSPSGSVKFDGRLREKIDLCVEHRIKAQNTEALVVPYQTRPGGFQAEFIGKWVTSALLACADQDHPEVRSAVDQTVGQLIATQSPDGYLGIYSDPQRARSTGDWDIWDRKYALLGLIAHHDVSGDVASLKAACAELDQLIKHVGPGAKPILETDLNVLKGLASSSILEPVALLYQRTGQTAYLDFANYIVTSWGQPSKYAPQGLHLMETAEAEKPPMKNHAYCITSCFEGVCELYRATGDPKFLKAALGFGQSIATYEVMINGGCANQELFCEGTRYQTEILEQPQETCAIVTWMKFCSQLLRLTGDSEWADHLETSLYNALLGAMVPEGQWWSYFSPLAGQRVPSHVQYAGDIHLSCCVANGPRALLLTSRWAVMSASEGPVVNLYAPGTANLKLGDGTDVRLVQETDYPVGGQIALTVTPSRTSPFTLRLRIPGWSKKTSLTINGADVPVQPGTYAQLNRTWNAGDKILLQLDMRGRAIPAPSGAPEFALMRGPVLLTLDNRLTPAQEIDAHLVMDGDGYVELKWSEKKSPDVWMSIDVPFEIKPSHFFLHRTVNLAMCDYSSAGNEWSDSNIFRVWLPQPLFLGDAYPADTWKLMYPKGEKPVMPPVPA